MTAHDNDEQLDVDAATGERLDVFGPPPAPRRTDPDTERYVRELFNSCPKCAVCGKPMAAGQRGTHLSCAPDYVPWVPPELRHAQLSTSTPNGVCRICGRRLHPAFGITAHYDCADKQYRRAVSDERS